MENIQAPTVLQKPFAEEGDKNTIPAQATGTNKANLTEGFPPITQKSVKKGGKPPEREDFNGAFNLTTQFYYAFQNGWLPTFNAEVSAAIGGYAQGAVLWYIDNGQIRALMSTKANNTDNFNTTPSVIGTSWVDVAPTKAYVDNLVQTTAAQKANTDLSNTPANIDYIVDSGGDSSAWYRLYKSGWLEQGGQVAVTSEATYTVSLLKAYANTAYLAFKNYGSARSDSNARDGEVSCFNKTKTQFQTVANPEDTALFDWFTMGWASNSVTLFNFHLTNDFNDSEGKQTVTNYGGAGPNATEEAFASGYSFEDLSGSGAAAGIIDSNYAFPRLSDPSSVLIGEEDFSISADIYVPTPTNENYNIPINIFTINGYMSNNVYRAFTFGLYIKKCYTANTTLGIGYRFSTGATTQTDAYTAAENLTTADVFDKWVSVKLERKAGVTKAYFAGEEIDFSDIQPLAYSLQTFEDYTLTTVNICSAQDVASSGSTSTTVNNTFKVKNLIMIKG